MLKQSSAGFTLVEVMVTIFVVAVGLLGAAAMQAASKKAAFDAIQRSNATVLAQEIIERMRGNTAALDTYQKAATEMKTPPPAVDCSPGKVCTPTQIANFDIYQWWLGLNGDGETFGTGTSAAGGLRNPTACIQRSATASNPATLLPGCRVAVVIAWRGLTTQSSAALGSTDPLNNPCGVTNPAYSDPASTSNSYRRVLIINTNLDQGINPSLANAC